MKSLPPGLDSGPIRIAEKEAGKGGSPGDHMIIFDVPMNFYARIMISFEIPLVLFAALEERRVPTEAKQNCEFRRTQPEGFRKGKGFPV